MRGSLSILWRCSGVVILCLVWTIGLERANGDDSEVGDPYPLLNCVILDEPLDRRAKRIDDDGRDIRVCSKECVEEFEKNGHTWLQVIDDRITQQQTKVYPTTKCIVDGQSLEEFGAIDFIFRNRLFRICSYDCQEKIEKKPGEYFEKLNKAVIEKQKPTYPLTKCVVSGKPLGKNALDLVVANQLVRLANEGMVDRFDQTPGKYLEAVRKAAEGNEK